MIKLQTPIFDSGLTVTLEGQGNKYIVYMTDTIHNKALNVKEFKDYEKALNNYNTRCIGL